MGKGWGLLHSYLGPCTKVGHLQASLKLDEQDIHWLECCNCTDAINEGIEMTGIANIFFSGRSARTPQGSKDFHNAA